MRTMSGIHPSVTVGDNVSLGADVSIGPNSVIHDNVTVSAGTVIGANVILGEPLARYYEDAATYVNPPLMIGCNAVIRSGSVLYAGSVIGDHFSSGHSVTIREGTRVGNYSRIGTQSDIQGDCEIGDYVRIHSNVITSQKVKICDFVWILPHCVLSDCPHPPSSELFPVLIEAFAVLAANAVILPGVTIGADSLVGAASVVRHDVLPGSVVVGQPARQVAWARDLKSRVTGRAMYPWRQHFQRGMPWEGTGFDAWDERRRTGGRDVN